MATFAGLIGGAFIETHLGRGSSVLLAPITVGGFLVFVIAAVRSSGFRCPRCGKSYFRRESGWLRYHDGYTQRCLNCGLPKWSTPSA